MCNYCENTEAAASWTNEFNWKGFFVTCAAVLENRSIMFMIEVCFVADMSPAMPIKKPEENTVRLEVVVVSSPWPVLCNLVYLIMSSKRSPKRLSKHLNCCYLSELLNVLNLFESSQMTGRTAFHHHYSSISACTAMILARWFLTSAIPKIMLFEFFLSIWTSIEFSFSLWAAWRSTCKAFRYVLFSISLYDVVWCVRSCKQGWGAEYIFP